ncbi:MAG: cation transporter [Clostridiales bacterium]|nr:cation transporter [Clostridiales bacterium]
MVKTYKLQNLGCANCAAKMEKSINKLDGVNSATMNFFMQKLTVDVEDGKLDEIMLEVKKICKKVEPDMKIMGL